MENMIIRTKFMKNLVSKVIAKELKKRGIDSEVEIDELELKLGKEPRVHIKVEADVLVKDFIEMINE